MSTLKLISLIVGLCPFFWNTYASPLDTSASKTEDSCNTTPTISCPAFVWLKPSESSHPNRTGYATAHPGSPTCEQPIVTYSDEIYIINACHKVYTRTWTATDPSNPLLSTSCTQEIKQVDEEAPIFATAQDDIIIYSNATDLASPVCSEQVTWPYPQVYDNHLLQSVTQTITHNGVVVDLASGSIFPAGITTVEYLAYDFCGNYSSISFTISVMCADCHLSCPSDITIGLNDDSSPAAVGSPLAYSGNMNCGTLSNTYYLDEVTDGGCGNKIVHRTWYGNFINMPNKTFSCKQTITIQDNSAITLYNCPQDLNVVDNFTKAQWPEPIAVASDNANILTLTSNYAPGHTFPVGITTVIYSARDLCGNEASCSFKVSVLTDATYPDCPDDIQIMCNENGVGVVAYTPPSYLGSCATCAHGGYKAGFMYIGSYKGSNYYCSSKFATYEEAQLQMAAHGGHLATINSAGENDFIASKIATSTALIGLTDVNSEGHFTWDDGSDVTYTNWDQMQPNDCMSWRYPARMYSMWEDPYLAIIYSQVLIALPTV